MKNIAERIEHSLLRPEATLEEIVVLCEEALHHGFYSVCIHPHFVSPARARLGRGDVRITTVVGFPLGATLSEVKVYEAERAVDLGADELDMVMNVGEAKRGNWSFVREDIARVVGAARGAVHKVIIEACYLSDEEKRKAAAVAVEAGADFVKTSTGFGPGGATVEDVKLLREALGGRARIKAAGGIRTLDGLCTMIEAGADLVGTSSGVRIMQEASEALEG
jgi:deoxyribose-phosphate aldolase